MAPKGGVERQKITVVPVLGWFGAFASQELLCSLQKKKCSHAFQVFCSGQQIARYVPWHFLGAGHTILEVGLGII